MFYIIGIGLNPKQMSLEARDVISKCSEVYIDNYTNQLSQGSVGHLEREIGKKITILSREKIEQDTAHIKENSCLLIIGNPLSATTHYSVYQDTKAKDLQVKIIPGISIFSYKGICGLSEYKFGKTTTIVYPKENFKPTSFYNTIEENLKIRAHSLCLLDIDTDNKMMMTIRDACSILKSIDKKKKLDKTIAIGLAGMGSDSQEVVCFEFNDFEKIKLKKFPQTLIICGELNEFEKGAINEFKI